MIRGAIFDLDGTVLDSMSVWATAASDYLKSIGVCPPEDVDGAVCTMSLEETAVYLIDRCKLELSAAAVMAQINRQIERKYFFEVQPKPGIAAVLDGLARRGVKLCMATATDLYQVRAALERCALSNYFPAVFTCTQAGAGKESPAVFEMARAYLNLPAQQIAVFEDAPHAARTAKRAGFYVIGIFDRFSADRQEALRASCDLYLESWTDSRVYERFG